MNWRTCALCFLSKVLLCCSLLQPMTVTAQGVSTPGQDKVCSRGQGTSYSPGATVQFANRVYRCWSVLGRDAQPSGVAWIPGEMQQNMFLLAEPTAGGECTLPESRHYTVGAAVKFGGSTYRCLNILDPDLKPAGVAWVEVELSGERFTIKGSR